MKKVIFFLSSLLFVLTFSWIQVWDSCIGNYFPFLPFTVPLRRFYSVPVIADSPMSSLFISPFPLLLIQRFFRIVFPLLAYFALSFPFSFLFLIVYSLFLAYLFSSPLPPQLFGASLFHLFFFSLSYYPTISSFLMSFLSVCLYSKDFDNGISLCSLGRIYFHHCDYHEQCTHI